MNAVSQEHSRSAVWLAVNSKYGDRLVEIAREHTALAKALIIDRESLSETDWEVYAARIAQLLQGARRNYPTICSGAGKTISVS